MKKKDDPRHKQRIEIVQVLFGLRFKNKLNKEEESKVEKILEARSAIDKIIENNAPAWPIDQIASVDLAVLRLAIWELLYKEKKEPTKVIIDEAIEIAKEFGSESSAGFVNGVLGSAVKSTKK